MANKVDFRTAYSFRPVPAPSPSGDGFEIKREFQTLPDGTRNLVEVGKTNAYEIIQASLEQSLIYNILRRHDAGDPTALAAVQGRYIDVSGLPTSLADFFFFSASLFCVFIAVLCHVVVYECNTDALASTPFYYYYLS